MSDTELGEREAAHLRGLLHRAAAQVEVPDRTSLDVPLPREPRRKGPGRWLAAAAVVALAGVGTLWWLGTPEERIETVPADPTVTVARHVLEERGIWRVPEGLDGYRLASAMGPSAMTVGILLAVDDVDEPSRWISLAAHGVEIPLDERTRVVELSDGLELLLRPVDGQDRITRYGLVLGGSSAYVTGTYRGVDDDEVVEVLSEAFADGEALAHPEGRAEALRRVRLPDGLVPTRSPGDVTFEQWGVATLTLEADDGTEVAVTLQHTGLPPAVAALHLRLLYLDLAAQGGSGETSFSHELEPRPDLGAHVLQLHARIGEQPAGAAVNRIIVITDDGTVVTAARVAGQDQLLAAEPLGEEEQVRIVNSLRSVASEAAFRAAVEAAGAEFVDPDADAVSGPAGAATTVVAPTTTEP